MADPKIRYVSKAGEFVNGIPAHDLSAEEYAALDKDQRAIVRDSPLYDYAGYREKVQAAKESAPPSDPPPAESRADAPAAPSLSVTVNDKPQGAA